jgi:hypothetical protein
VGVIAGVPADPALILARLAEREHCLLLKSVGRVCAGTNLKMSTSVRFGGLDYHASISGFYFPVPLTSFLAATPTTQQRSWPEDMIPLQRLTPEQYKAGMDVQFWLYSAG